jgi:hypothetical protein
MTEYLSENINYIREVLSNYIKDDWGEYPFLYDLKVWYDPSMHEYRMDLLKKIEVSFGDTFAVMCDINTPPSILNLRYEGIACVRSLRFTESVFNNCNDMGVKIIWKRMVEKLFNDYKNDILGRSVIND